MRKRVLPAMALTYEAFCVCIEQGVEVIYIDMQIYRAYANEVFQKLKDNGYNFKGRVARRGVFFARGIDLFCCDISDPYQLF